MLFTEGENEGDLQLGVFENIVSVQYRSMILRKPEHIFT